MTCVFCVAFPMKLLVRSLCTTFLTMMTIVSVGLRAFFWERWRLRPAMFVTVRSLYATFLTMMITVSMGLRAFYWERWRLEPTVALTVALTVAMIVRFGLRATRDAVLNPLKFSEDATSLRRGRIKIQRLL